MCVKVLEVWGELIHKNTKIIEHPPMLTTEGILGILLTKMIDIRVKIEKIAYFSLKEQLSIFIEVLVTLFIGLDRKTFGFLLIG